MLNDQPHRKRVRHYDEPGQAHELTFSCYRRTPLLTNDRWKTSLSHSIDQAIRKRGFELVAFVYMPEHVHLIVFPCDERAAIARLLSGIKRPFSFRVKRDLQNNDPSLLRRLTIRERPGTNTFRFWQEGAGYDRNVVSVKTLEAAVDYVHGNPVRRGLCGSPDQWKWSSWRHYNDPREGADPDLPMVHGFLP